MFFSFPVFLAISSAPLLQSSSTELSKNLSENFYCSEFHVPLFLTIQEACKRDFGNSFSVRKKGSSEIETYYNHDLSGGNKITYESSYKKEPLDKEKAEFSISYHFESQGEKKRVSRNYETPFRGLPTKSSTDIEMQ